MAIKYMAEMKKRPKEDWATRPRKKSYLYQNQIAEVDNLLKTDDAMKKAIKQLTNQLKA